MKNIRFKNRMSLSNMHKLRITHGAILRWYAFKASTIALVAIVGYSAYIGASELLEQRQELSRANSALSDAFSVLTGEKVIEERTSDRYVLVTQVNQHFEERYEK